MLTGYARVSTRGQDITAQLDGLGQLGVDRERIHTDKLTSKPTNRPGLDAALAATRAGDHFVVTQLERLGRSARDILTIAEELFARGVTMQVGATVHDPDDPFGQLWLTHFAAFVDLEGRLASVRTKEGLEVARKKGRLRGKPPKLSEPQHLEVLAEYESGEISPGDLAEDYGVDRATIYRTIDRAKRLREGSQ